MTDKGTGSQIAEGHRLYLENGCSLCHGDDGRGDGPLAATLPTRPRDYTSPDAFASDVTAEDIAGVIAAGIPQPGGGMPAYEHLPAEQRLLLARYIDSLRAGNGS